MTHVASRTTAAPVALYSSMNSSLAPAAPRLRIWLMTTCPIPHVTPPELDEAEDDELAATVVDEDDAAEVDDDEATAVDEDVDPPAEALVDDAPPVAMPPLPVLAPPVPVPPWPAEPVLAPPWPIPPVPALVLVPTVALELVLDVPVLVEPVAAEPPPPPVPAVPELVLEPVWLSCAKGS